MYDNRKVHRMVNYMKPRIFVSSTFYDLKYIREDLSNFIRAHDFEPIMFEDGDIGYTPGKSLDESCYETMRSTDMLLLIIGGNYGSAASGEKKEGFKEYLSVTRKEFRNAVNNGVPMYVFIDKKVYTEFEVYEANHDGIEYENQQIFFNNTKDINVFRFIKEIKNIGHIVITEFDKVVEIKDFLSKQWADMFKRYLEMLKNNKSNKAIEDSVNDLKLLTENMNVMLNGVGKKILATDNSNEYDEVVEMQNIILLAYRICNTFKVNDISLIDSEEKRREKIEKLLSATYESLKKDLWFNFNSNDDDKVKRLFKLYEANGIDIYGFAVVTEKSLSELLKIWENNKAKKLLIDEIVKDDNYINLG